MPEPTPIELYVATTGDDTVCSGSSPTPQASGSAASTDGSAVVDLAADGPDLSAVAADLTADLTPTIRIADATGGFGSIDAVKDVHVIVAVDNVAKTVTVDAAHTMDTASGKAWCIGGAFASIDRATRLVHKDDDFDVGRIHVKAGTYTSGHSVSGITAHAGMYVNGTAARPVVIQGYKDSPGDATVEHWGDDAYRFVIDGAPDDLSVGFHNKIPCQMIGYAIRNGVIKRCLNAGIISATIRDALFVNCAFTQNANDGVYLGPNHTFVGCTFANNGRYGLFAGNTVAHACSFHDNGATDGQWAGQRIVASTCTFYGLPAGGHAVGLRADTTAALILNCTIDGEDTASTRGVSMLDDALAVVANTIVVRCATALHGVNAVAGIPSLNNLLHGNTSNFDDWSGDENTVTGDPGFVDQEGHDYRLKAESPGQWSGYPANQDRGAHPSGPIGTGQALNKGMQA